LTESSGVLYYSKLFKLAKHVRDVMVAPVITVNPSGTILKSMARGRT